MSELVTKEIYCCGCVTDVIARLTTGAEIYPHRPDLATLPFWRCDTCSNHVGCHHKTKNRTQPIGVISTPAIREARKKIHAILDPIWQSGKKSRRAIYKAISNEIGREYHTGNIRTIEDARDVYRIVQNMGRQA